ncbi:MAG: hypothetical protein ACR2KZ_18630 [Segetibacter sp.]
MLQGVTVSVPGNSKTNVTSDASGSNAKVNTKGLYTGSISNPSFKALWAPIDGRVVNLAIRFKPYDSW